MLKMAKESYPKKNNEELQKIIIKESIKHFDKNSSFFNELLELSDSIVKRYVEFNINSIGIYSDVYGKTPTEEEITSIDRNAMLKKTSICRTAHDEIINFYYDEKNKNNKIKNIF